MCEGNKNVYKMLTGERKGVKPDRRMRG